MATLTGDPEIDAFNKLEEERKQKERAAMTHSEPLLASAAPPRPSAASTLLDSPMERKPREEDLPPATPPPPVKAVPMPKPEMVTTGSTTTSGGGEKQFRVKTEAEKVAETQLTGLQPALTQAEQKKADAAYTQAKSDAEQRSAENSAIVDQQAKDEIGRQRLEGVRTKAVDYLAQKRQEVEKFQQKDLWDDKPAGAQFLAIILSGVGDFGARMAGGKAGGVDAIIESAVERNYQKEKARFEQSKYVAELAGRSQEEADRAIAIHDVEATNRKAGILEKGIRDRQAFLSKRGMSEAEIAKDNVTNLMSEKALKAKIEAEEKLRPLITERQATTVTRRDIVDPGAGGGANVVYGQGGQPLFQTKTPDEAKEAGKATEAMRKLLYLVNEHEKDLEKGPAWGKDQDARNKRQRQITLAIKNAEQLGAIDKGSIEVTEDILPASYGATGSGLELTKSFKQDVLAAGAISFDRYGVPGQKVVDRIYSDSVARPQMTAQEQAKLVAERNRLPGGSPERERIDRALASGGAGGR